ncbi:sigma-54-dependent Fis family transcriptional regulator [candidate division WOR-3 bacterium]|nr:sigma-54-dependent Fis family transcriptional regulator [candidate division WOR-3 bacterium]
MKQKILLLDDEESLIKWLSYALEQKGYSVFSTTEPEHALTTLRQEKFDGIISDIRMPGMSGFDFLKKVRTIYPRVPVIFITAYGSIESAITALRDRASDYILKPFSIEEMVVRLRENLRRKDEDQTSIIGTSKQIKEVLALTNKVATTDTTVLILGESGTGKELIAREIHKRSNRAKNKFVSISCAALPETLLESELFGYKRGAFTGANSDKDGLFKIADKGTFFLDEIGDAPSTIQMKLLRFLEEKTITPLGSTQELGVNVRLIAASNKDLMAEVKKGTFREDLYYRLNVIPVVLPPLRQRTHDIPILADFFLDSICAQEHLGEKKFSDATLDFLKKYPWPGNIRELKHIVERAAILSESYYINIEHLGLPIVAKGKQKSLDQLQEQEIRTVLTECGGNVTRAARVLGVGRATLYRKLREYDTRGKKPRKKRRGKNRRQ